MAKPRAVSGMQPTGMLHLGNLEGALCNWVRLQDKYDLFAFVADWHALTTLYAKPELIAKYTKELVIDYIASGLNPEKTTIFRQSDVKDHAELHLLLSMITPVSWLERVPTYKEKRQELRPESPSYGLLGYPVLQAADILIYNAEGVPVGRDQLPHLEVTREIARRFNSLYGLIFKEPHAILTETPVVIGLDGRKMSKSHENTILISDPPEVVEEKIRTMYTDPLKIYRTDIGHPETCPVFQLRLIYAKEEAPQVERKCKTGEIGCVQDKQELAKAINQRLEPIRKRRRELEQHPELIDQILVDGAGRARAVAQETMEKVRESMAFNSQTLISYNIMKK
ncbi:MAG: tryptophan--tRNA ligase [Armatimonadota bacterium]|nr:tryptophan--tRNA ligase [Armatimonadota bacterium]